MVVDSKGAAAAAEDNSRLTLFGMLLVALSATSGLLFGYDTGVVSGAMLLVRNEMKLTDFWHEVIVAATIGAAWAFSLVGGFLTDGFGRRRTILVAAVVFTAGSLVMGFANGKEMLLAGRIIVGIGVGLASMSTPVYIAECSAPKYRGVLVMLYTLGTTGGQFVAGIICGLFANVEEGWRWMLGLAAVPSLVLLVGFIYLPESPRYLVAQGSLDEAEQVLQRLRGPDVSVHAEIKGIREACEEEGRRGGGKRNLLACIWRIWRIWRTKHARRALVLGCALQAYQQLAGINTAMYYSATIIKMAGIGSDSTAIWLSAGTAGVNCVCTLIGIAMVDRIGRRPLALGSLFGAAVSLAILGGAFLMMDHTAPAITDATVGGACSALSSCTDCISKNCGFCLLGNGSATCWPHDADTGAAQLGFCSAPLADGAVWATDYCPSDYSWMAVVGIVVYLFCFAPGMGPVPWVLNSEIHAMWARDVSTSLATSSNWMFNLIMSLTFLSLIEVLTTAGAFFLYACITLTGVLVMWFILPETKGTTLEEIEYLFGKKQDDAHPEGSDGRPVQTVMVIDVRP